MVDVPRALPPSDAERLAILRSHGFPGNLAGESRNVGNPVSRDALAAAGVGGGSEDESLGDRSHFAEILKLAGEAPAGTYELTFDPVDDPYWPQVFCGGALQVADRDYTISAQTLTVLDAMDLRTGNELYCDYDYLDGVPTTPPDFVEPPPPPDPEDFPALALVSYTLSGGNPRTWTGLVEGVFPGDENNFYLQYIDVSHGHGDARNVTFTIIDADLGLVQLDNTRIRPWYGGEDPTGFKLYMNLSNDLMVAHYGVGVSQVLFDGDATVTP